MVNGDYAASVCYSGDVIQLQVDHPEIKFVFPDSGASVYTDNFVIPAYAQHKTNAEKLINFYYDPIHSAHLYSYIKYIEPVAGTQELMKKIAPQLADNELIFPSDQQIKTLRVFKDLSATEEAEYFRAFQRMIGE